ncbi:MAG: glutamate racemase, partial [Pontibacter sp.]|nr:glutamate racemase [Pontibacter sp.]
HYPLIKKQIEKYYEGHVDVLDASQIVAQHVKDYLEQHNLAADKLKGDHHFYVSDFTRSFEESTRIFFKRKVHLEHYPLWE